MDIHVPVEVDDEFTSVELTERQKEKTRHYLQNRGKLFEAARQSITKHKRKAKFKSLRKGGIDPLCKAWLEKIKSSLGKDRFTKFHRYVCDGLNFCNNKVDYDILATIVALVIGLLNAIAGAIAGLLFIFLSRCGDQFCNCEARRNSQPA